MEYREIDERYELVIERIFELRSNTEVLEKYQDYFKQAAEFICLADCVLQLFESADGSSHFRRGVWKAPLLFVYRTTCFDGICV